MKHNWIKIFLLALTASLIVSCSDDNENETILKAERPTTLKGKLLYHSYSDYNALDSEIFIYDFATNEVKNLSKDWGIKNAMNAHASPNGKQIVFMGLGEETGTWDIFLYNLDGNTSPENLTPMGTSKDEDPKFSPDGKRVVFKHDQRIAEMNLETKVITRLSPRDYGIPYYNHDGTQVVCTYSDGPTSSIAIIDVKTREIKETVYDAENVQDYYPINADQTSFYYSVGLDPNNRLDQVYRGYWSGLRSKKLPFNSNDGNYSDAYPVNSDWLVLCSTRPGGLGGYDLYIANVNTGDIYTMTDYNEGINTGKEELGPCYLPENSK